MIDFAASSPQFIAGAMVGAAAGYGFAMRTAVATTKEHMRVVVGDLRGRISKLEEKLDERTQQAIQLAQRNEV